MLAVIQAGGMGTRLHEITKDKIPKPMVKLLKKPILQWQIENLKKNNILEIIIIIGHLGNVITEYFKDGSDFGVSISYIEERTALGSAGALFYLKKTAKTLREPILLVYGDIFFDMEIKRMCVFHNEKKSEATLAIHPNLHPMDSDLVKMDEEGQILKFLRKNEKRERWQYNTVNAGLYLLNASVLEQLEEEKATDLERDILEPFLYTNKRVYGYYTSEYMKDVGTKERLYSVEQDILRKYPEKRNLSQKQKCVFLDRDGTINKYCGFIKSEEEFELEESSAEAIRLLNNSDYLAIMVTNQPVVARGLCDMETVHLIHRKMSTLLGEQGAYLDDMVFCPHHPDKGYMGENAAYKIKCSCRKPKIGMIQKMTEKYHIDLELSWIIGDTTVDMQTGYRAGMHTALVATGQAGMDGRYQVQPDIKASNLLDAVKKYWETHNGGRIRDINGVSKGNKGLY